ncbi:MAG TPA: SCO2522 family protein [Actinocrinis sp.]|nr:SCO2522 family protein [Actinocrinis sp.]
MDTSFHEATAERRTQEVPYCHLSVELDHLYMEDFAEGRAQLPRRFARLAPWFAATVESFAARHAISQPRVSTCFLIDDYFSDLVPPAELIGPVCEAAEQAGLRIDYLAREAACARWDGIGLADQVAARLVSVPTQGTTGARPPTTETGWLSNGARSPGGAIAALQPRAWAPPLEAEARRHSIFLDVELWNEAGGRRTWSCPMLAAVWQLLRLGLLRDQGRAVLAAQPLPDGPLPDSWQKLPGVIKLNPDAQAFHGYRTASLLEQRFLPIEHAVRVVLSQVAQDADAMAQVAKRAGREGMPVPDDVTGRVSYVFLPEQ